MKLCYDRNSKDPTYFVQVGFRNGKKVTTKNIARIGKHSELLEKTDDPLAYAKAYVAQCNEEAKNTNKVGMEFNLDFAEKVMFLEKQVSESTLKNIGYLYLQHIYFMLGIDEFFSDKTKDSKVTFDPDCVNRFMTYLRILKPDSKLGSFENKDGFYEEPDFDYHHIMRTMDLLAENYNEYIEYLYKASNKIVKRNTTVCFYDCTNYYSEAVYQDEDYVDPVTGELLRGLRKYGVSKEHRPNPLVEMGLFMDTDGIPISMCIAPGSTNEHETVMPLERELIRMFKDKEKKFIYCADAGLGSYHIRNFNSMGGRAFIVTQSIKKLSDELKAQVFGDYGYRRLSDDSFISVKAMKEFDKTDKNNLPLYNDRAYKILIADTPVDVGLFEEKEYKNGKKVKVKSKTILRQYVIVTFSRKSFEYQHYVRNRQIERAKKLLEYMTPEDYRKGPNDITRFIKKQGNTKDKYELDVERIENEEKYDGYYAVATNLEDPAKDILAISEQRYKIEDCFRILKTDFVSRPYFHRTRRRIIAHFMICYTALLIYRLLETKLNKCFKGCHFTTRNIVETLQNLNVANIADVFFAAQYTGSRTLCALEGTFPMGLNAKYFRPKDLNAKCRKSFLNHK